MNKICCVGDANICPKSSSCSMVLRSACSHTHKHSRESSTVKEHSHDSSHRKSKRVSVSKKKKDSCNGNLRLESALESSLKQLALKSVEETYSLLKKGFYNSFEFSESADQKLFDTNSFNVSCAKELQFSQLSTSNDSSVFNNINHKECSTDYSSATESDINSSEIFDSTSNMSNSSSRRRFLRSSINSMRTLSGSEGEDDISIERILKPVKSISMSDNSLNFHTKKTLFSENEASNQTLFNNHNSHFETQHMNNHFSRYTGSSESDDSLSRLNVSSHLDRSSVQCTLFDKFRWFLWRCIYLVMVRNINFDIWILSRLHKYGKHKVILFLLMPLLFFLFWGLTQNHSIWYETVPSVINSTVSSVLTALSLPFSSLYNYFVPMEEVVISETHDTVCSAGITRIFKFIPTLSGIFGTVSGWFVRTGGSASLVTETNYQAEGALNYKTEEEIKLFQPSREEVKILATEILKDESLKEFIKTSVHGTQAEKLKREQNLQNEIKSLRLEFQSLSGTLERLETDIKRQREKSETTESVIELTSEYKDKINHLNVKLKTIETKLEDLEKLKSCCNKQWSPDDFIKLLETHLISAFRNVVDGDSDPGSKYYFFNQWLSSKYFSHEKLMQEINAALRRQSLLRSENAVNYDNVIKVVESTVVEHMDSIKKNLSAMNMAGYSTFSKDIFSENKIKKIVKEAIMLYDADKTGQVDYALESGGGSVLGTRCSETYVEKYGKISFFSIPLWTSSNSPRTAIQPDVQPGRCWAFKGSQGFLVLELSATIYPTGFTLEHIPISLSPTGSIDSAPKNFSVWGLDSERDNKGKLLGEYSYDINGEPLQYFPVKTPSEQPYSYVELQIHSNHGNMEYTCLYRFRVHGQRVR